MLDNKLSVAGVYAEDMQNKLWNMNVCFVVDKQHPIRRHLQCIKSRVDEPAAQETAGERMNGTKRVNEISPSYQVIKFIRFIVCMRAVNLIPTLMWTAAVGRIHKELRS